MNNQMTLSLIDNAKLIAGVDEVGRGPLAGPVVAAAVILNPENMIDGLRDSKKLSEKKRESLVDIIHEQSIAFAYGRAEVEEIDELNILQASLLAMKRAIESLPVQPEHVLVDGNQVPRVNYPVTPVIGGDDCESCIAAASIIAKVKRDREMLDLHEQYPVYGFDRHKGYPTRVHMEAIEQHGITDFHRRSFKPVKRVLERC